MADKFKHPRGQHKGKRIADPVPVPSAPPQQQTPIFCMEFLGGDFCLTRCNKDQKAALADRLHLLSKMRWAEIDVAHRHGTGYERIGRSSLNAPIPEAVKNLITDDVNIIAFRFFGKAPMIGFRQGRIFHILFLDIHFNAYKH